MSTKYRHQVLQLYRTLYYMGKEYPKGADWFHSRLKNAFQKNMNEADDQKVAELLKRGEFVVKELEALYSLRKYRAMKNRYYDEN
ncbi:hypothetical protein L596_003908 [Steinernema carpocapsae]|uniref:Complex 1 LYR protein domain-containing protein n=1 Tax=Steinernema carpocapsae TaxID=34508 RepID=A0A4U8UTX3_STECR|nr:hypothetical protein L596_003908 [Steinernema carpocapsae]